ncbi:hypothetical protein GMA19_03071 [Paenibacillus polymyxa E681]|uniref:hypothetical protein n=1 Tax=Paenibacillus polymyxa TaxID=1406 RepID=UPI0005C55E6C|nr:hypothetical protein [Paenibacillus polymyxa]AJW69275.1 hypothetical protein PPE_06040 [Paenibacillus polymyxa E681]QNV57900.1 hypothetical protein GE561_03071 [Paenibacillus polymyxa E681]QNV62737.1 hypothetical protein GMA19_03071 [Paenibacillus polymyxa E681]
MTEQEADEFTTALSERYAQIRKNNSHNNKLLSLWDGVIETLPPDIKRGFEEKYDHLVRESSS